MLPPGSRSRDFGDKGEVNLRNGLRIPVRHFSDYEETSPPAIVGDTIVVGSGVADNGAVDQPSGEVRGYDAVTGKLKWTWHPISAEPKAPGAANTWSVIAADSGRGLVFLPVSSPSPDYYGGERPGDNLLREFPCCPEGFDGRARVALPDRASRSVGLRYCFAADSV